jgi:hypothetical protein
MQRAKNQTIAKEVVTTKLSFTVFPSHHLSFNDAYPSDSTFLRAMPNASDPLLVSFSSGLKYPPHELHLALQSHPNESCA